MSTKKVPVNDKKSIVKYKVLCSEKYGRYLVAGRKINEGEVIIREKPVGIGPRVFNDDLCFECLRIIPMCVAKGSSSFLCSNCKVAIFCCVACEARKFYHTIEECEILKNKTISFRVKEVLLPLRLWLIKKKDEELWEKILRLEAHLEARRDTIEWKICEENVINALKSLGIVDKSEENQFSELLQRISGILDVNSFAARPPESHNNFALRGLYLEASLMTHDCRGNTFSTIDDKFQLTIYASKPIDDGEMILLNYLSPLLGTGERQKQLREGKYFECDCPLCQDPQELGTNLSTMFCPYCSDGLITFTSVKTKNPYVKEKNWKCNKCQISLSGYLIAFYLFLVKMRIKSVENSIKGLEVLIEQLSPIFHPNHFLMLDIKQRLLALYKNEPECQNSSKKKLNRMIEIGTDILKIVEILEPGISCHKGALLCTMHVVNFYLTNRDNITRKIPPKEFVRILEKMTKQLKRPLTMLQYAPASTPVYKMDAEQQPGPANPAPIEMIAEEPPAKRQRVVVDAFTREERPDVSKTNIKLNPELKVKVIKFITNVQKEITDLLTPLTGHVELSKDLAVGDQIHNVSFTHYNMLRQRAGNTGGTLANKILGTEYKFRIANKDLTLTHLQVDTVMKAKAVELALEFKKYGREDKDNWFSIAGPMYSCLSGFGLRWKELRVGYKTFALNKAESAKIVKLEQYGIYDRHHILCEGMTWPPEKRSFMATLLGPLTVLVCYIRSDTMYKLKWEKAVLRAFAQIPHIADVLVALNTAPSRSTNLITLVADIALMTTKREAYRMFPPPGAFSLLIKEDPELVKHFYFSGKGAFLFYKAFSKHNWAMTVPTEMSDEVMKQLTYHSMFGTFKEDFGVLTDITDYGAWKTREEIGSVFRTENRERKHIVFSPIKQKYYAKLCQASQSNLLSRRSGQLSSLPVFSGKTIRVYTDVFFKAMEADDQDPIHPIANTNLVGVINTLINERNKLKEKLKNNTKMVYGRTVTWRELESLSYVADGKESDIIPRVNGRLFLEKQ